MKILIMGLPGTGKTTFALSLAARLGAIHFNADDIRTIIYPELSFTLESRLNNAKRMGHLADLVLASNNIAVCDFICPTESCKVAFTEKNPAYIIWMRHTPCRDFPDTTAMFEEPKEVDLQVFRWDTRHTLERLWHEEKFCRLYNEYKHNRKQLNLSCSV